MGRKAQPKEGVFVGAKFGRWTIIGTQGSSWVYCRCHCGVERYVVVQALAMGKSKSCGCYARDLARLPKREYDWPMLDSYAARVYRAVARCSRNKWLSPNIVSDMAFSFAKCLEKDAYYAVALRAMQGRIDIQDCTEIGLLRGYPPFNRSQPSYELFRDFVREKAFPKGQPPELVILNLTVKEAFDGSKPTSYFRRRSPDDHRYHRGAQGRSHRGIAWNGYGGQLQGSK